MTPEAYKAAVGQVMAIGTVAQDVDLEGIITSIDNLPPSPLLDVIAPMSHLQLRAGEKRLQALREAVWQLQLFQRSYLRFTQVVAETHAHAQHGATP